MNRDAPLARRAPAWTRALVWVLFGILAAASAWAFANPAEMNSAVVSVAPDGTSQVSYVPASELPNAAAVNAQRPDDELLAAGKRTASTVYTGQTKFGSAGSWYSNAEANDLLPMTRWASSGLEGTPSGTLDFGTTFSTMLGTLMFTLAGFGWTVLAWVLSKAMTLDAVAGFGDKINDMSLVLGGGLIGSGAIAILVFVAVLTVCGLVIKKGGRGSLRVIVALLVPLAAMQVMVTSATVAGKAGDADAARNSAAWGLTPAGLAERGSDAVSLVTAGMVEGIADATIKTTDLDVVKGPCSYYLNTLYNAYDAKLDDGSGTATMHAASILWEIAYLTPITEAQYGDVSEGARGICHRLEEGRVVPTSDRMAIAGVGDSKSPYSNITSDVEDIEGYNPFQRVSDNWDRTTNHLGWVACDYENGTNGRASWEMEGGDDINSFCEAWTSGKWTGNDSGDDIMEFKSGKDAEERDYNSATKPLQYKVIVYNLGQAGGGDKFMLGLSALLNAGAYLMALSMPALGAALSSLGLTLFLMLLPVTLFMCAGGAGMKKMGMRLLRVTGSFIAAKALLVVLIAITVQLIILYSMLFGLL